MTDAVVHPIPFNLVKSYLLTIACLKASQVLNSSARIIAVCFSTFGIPAEAISQTKFEHIKQGVQYYIEEHKIKDFRIDVIGITLKPEIKIEHLKNVYL